MVVGMGNRPGRGLLMYWTYIVRMANLNFQGFYEGKAGCKACGCYTQASLSSSESRAGCVGFNLVYCADSRGGRERSKNDNASWKSCFLLHRLFVSFRLFSTRSNVTKNGIFGQCSTIFGWKP